MKSVEYVEETELAAFAKKFRLASGKTKVEVAKEMGIKPPSVHHAEESPHLSFTKLRRRMIEAYSDLKVSGPLFKLEPKR
jgi:hypothetical protein